MLHELGVQQDAAQCRLHWSVGYYHQGLICIVSGHGDDILQSAHDKDDPDKYAMIPFCNEVQQDVKVLSSDPFDPCKDYIALLHVDLQ